MGLALGVLFFLKIYQTDINAVIDYKPRLTTQFYDAKNRLLANTFEDEHRLYVHFDDLPSRVVEAIVAIEDTSFFEHNGINLEAIIRAAFKVAIARKAVEGASTITQQLVKNVLLSRDKTFERKAKEAILALKVERYLSKEEILERYLNEIFFGHGYYGIKTAANGYFRKDLDELSIKEIAILVGLPRAPSFYDPTRHKLHALARANIVISRMYNLGWISDDEYAQAIAEDPITYDDTRTLNQAPYAIDYINQLLKDKYPDLKTGGYSVYTSIDLDAQEIAQNALEKAYNDTLIRVENFLLQDKAKEYREYKKALELYESKKDELKEKLALVNNQEADVSFENILLNDYVFDQAKSLDEILESFDIKRPTMDESVDLKATQNRLSQLNGAMIVTEQKTGNILAMLGGVDYSKSEFNRATQSERQLGSVFKPFLYLASFDLGYSPASIVPDISRTYSFPIGEDEEQVWKPSNYEQNFEGLMTQRKAIVHSRNLAAINLVTSVGLDLIYEKLEGFGFNGLPKDLSISLGAHSMSPINLSAHYTLISNYGTVTAPRIITAITDQFGNKTDFSPKETTLDKPEQAYLMIDILKETVNKGTGRRSRVAGIEIGGKTGTTNENKDVWFFGFTPNIQAVVWFGNDNFLQISDKETGGRVAAPVFADFVKNYLKIRPELKRKFDMPPKVYEIKNSKGQREIFTEISKPPKTPKTIKEELLF